LGIGLTAVLSEYSAVEICAAPNMPIVGGRMVKHLLAWALLSCVALYAEDQPSYRAHVNSGYAHAAKIVTAAAKGEAAARFELGMLHEKGEVLAQNHKEAAKWFHLSADEGYAPAQLYLGLLYLSGKGVDRDYGQAVRYLTLAAEQNEADAQFLLGGIYFGDTVVPHNYVESYKWFRLASIKGNGESQNPLDSVSKRMSPQQVAEAERLIREFNHTHKR
jgi:TPR repeat protein